MVHSFFSYLKQHFRLLLAFAGCSAIFFCVFSLYQAPLEPLLYALSLCLFFLLLLGALDFLSYRRRHLTLQQMQNSITSLLPKLPLAATCIEKDYQILLKQLDESRAQAISQKDHALTELSEYYSLWAHQIKTPISAMRLILQSEENANTSLLYEQLFSIEQYVEMALGYLRTQSISNDMVLRTVSLDALLRQSIKKFAPLFIRKRITLNYTPTEFSILTDEKWFCFVIEQLLSNALKYTAKGSISIHAQPGSQKILIIRDTGIGIAPEDLPRLGERGFTGYNGRENQKSTGLGLYLCRSILSHLSLRMEISSEIGKGTTIFLYLDTQPLQAE